MCSTSGQMLFVCSAKDCPGNHKLSTSKQLSVKKCLVMKKTKLLLDEIEIAIGMKVLVTYNMETNLDITNGPCGTIMDIIFDP